MIAPAPESKITETKLLVSVRDEAEAVAALSGGADWIDLKEPRAGALGAVDLATAADVARSVGTRCPLSAALGEMRGWQDTHAPSLLEVAEISYVKLGLSGCAGDSTWKSRWQRTDAEMSAAGKLLVAVAYADWHLAHGPAPTEVLALAAQSSARCLLVDTFDKNAGSTPELLQDAELRELVHQAKSCGVMVVLAGKLQRECLTSLPLEFVDLVAVRSAVCSAGRNGSVERSLVSQLKVALDVSNQRVGRPESGTEAAQKTQ